MPLLGRRCRSLQISPDLCGFLGRQPPGGYQLIQTAIVPKAGIVGPRHIIHCHNATPCMAAKKSTSARSCSWAVGGGAGTPSSSTVICP